MATLSQNITQAISDLNSIKTAIQAKGVTVASGTPTADYAGLIGDILSGDDNVFAGVVDGSTTTVTIPNGATKIKQYLFYNSSVLQSITVPEGVTTIESYAFYCCIRLSSVQLPNSLTGINNNAFFGCVALQSVNLGSNLATVGSYAFNSTGLTTLIIPSSVTSIDSRAFRDNSHLTTLTIQFTNANIASMVFQGCSALVNVTLPSGFNSNNLDLSASTQYTAQTIVSWLNALADRTGQTAYSLGLGSTNIAKLTAEEIAIATSKNWNLT